MAAIDSQAKIILIRHGQSAANVGLSDDPNCALTPTGIEQARQAARRLAQEVDTTAYKLLVSPYRRARQTANVIAQRIGGEFQIHPPIREWGPPCSIDGVVYDTETREQLIARMREVLDQLRTGQSILVSHAAPIAMLLHIAQGRESQIGDSCFWEGIENCCLICM
jgi:2,3-bisphosphoglycerate-dependent phosphoglycerate mutase